MRKTELNLVQAVFLIKGNFAFEFEFGLIDFLEELFQRLLVFEICFLFEAAFGEEFDEARVRGDGEPSLAAAASYS